MNFLGHTLECKEDTVSRMFKMEGGERSAFSLRGKQYILWGPLEFTLEKETYEVNFIAEIARTKIDDFYCINLYKNAGGVKSHSNIILSGVPPFITEWLNFGEYDMATDIEFDEDSGRIAFPAHYDENIRICTKLKSKKPSERKALLTFFQYRNTENKGQHDMSASRKRNPSPETAIPAPLAPPPLEALAAEAPAVPDPVPTAPIVPDPVPVAEEVPDPAPVVPDPVPAAEEVPDPVESEPEVPDPVAASQQEEQDLGEVEAAEPDPEPAPEPTPEAEEPAPKPYTGVREKAPSKGEHNSAAKLEEKGWDCFPHLHEGMDIGTLIELVAKSERLRSIYTNALIETAQADKMTEADKERYRAEGRQQIRAKLNSL